MGILKNLLKPFKMVFVDNNPLFDAYNQDAKSRRERAEQQSRECAERDHREQMAQLQKDQNDLLRDILRKL